MNESVNLKPTGKIVELDELPAALEPHRRRGSQIVLCHGAFDLLHIGHLRHLKAAAQYGHVLVVTITEDSFINKGPDRPVFTARLRAEMLAAMEIVDFVAIVDAPTGLPSIDVVRPNFYVKGHEYEDASRDVTGMIAVERERVGKHGGELVFTSELTESSSRLLNRYFGTINGAARDYLEIQRGRGLEARVVDCLDRLENLKIVVVGETIIDRYVYVNALGKSAKENIIATLRRHEEVFAGGTIAAANHLSGLCPNVELITLVGSGSDGDNYEELIRSSLGNSVNVEFVRRPKGPTVRKTRFVEPTYVRKLFEVYDMDDEPLPPSHQARLNALLVEKIKGADLVVVCDFGHGMIGRSTIDLLESAAPMLAINVQSNAGNIGFNLVSKYSRADFVCVDALEARLASNEKHAPLAEVAGRMPGVLPGCQNFIVTSGKAGCYAVRGGSVVHVPAFSDVVVDTVGAGDAFFVVAASFMAAEADCETAGLMGNIAGAIKVGIVGHRRSVTRLEIQRYLTTLLK